MTDSYSDSRHQGGQGDNGRDGRRGGRGGRGQGNREGGGFRIRLSDNEMRSARALQEAFNLRSTVAVLGFAVRTLGQMLEEGKLEELVAQQRAQGNQGSRGGGRRDDDRGGRREGRGEGGRGSRPDPFARPAKPQPPAPEPEPEEVAETAAPAEADSTSQQPAGDDGANQDSTAEA
ncbi:hypothetical protein MITS9509_01954 [Synechococcus sp. MIT S9509]|uniref:hypothetical protein n=1 Tax=unclassified Synechococcus TaxID=2626047 RepID=UPI0007BC09F4|nr:MULTISPECIES: hypothetical protein [unclassified Synechococcus]KZR85970.1 hypothetical protein MITS9504_01753 [Synechococcus sp. MIT S9504]KZR92033.1 hypothetical protein MITS9509_01954 [Synechococcus sp. MIT S9509]